MADHFFPSRLSYVCEDRLTSVASPRLPFAITYLSRAGTVLSGNSVSSRCECVFIASVHSVPENDGWRAARVGNDGFRTTAGQSGQLADSSAIRSGESGVATLDSFLLAAFPFRSLRRARLWNDSVAGARSLVATVGGRSGGGDLGGGAGRTHDLARNLAGIRDLHCVRGETSRAR